MKTQCAKIEALFTIATVRSPKTFVSFMKFSAQFFG